MQEIELRNNNTGYKVFVDNSPIKDLIPKEQIEIFANALVLEIFEILQARERRRQYYLKNKKLIRKSLSWKIEIRVLTFCGKCIIIRLSLTQVNKMGKGRYYATQE